MQEKNSALLKNAEISQSEKRLEQELRKESCELNEQFETTQNLLKEIQSNRDELIESKKRIVELETKLNDQQQAIDRIDDLNQDIHDKNKVSRK